MIRILFLTMISFFATQITQAQTKEAQIAKIRKTYTDAKKDVDNNGKNGHKNNVLQFLNYDQERDETPVSMEDIQIYYAYDQSEPKPYFITQKYKYGDIDIYREWLFDSSDHSLLFIYEHKEQNDGKPIEIRYYWNDGNLIEKVTRTQNLEPDYHFILYRISQQFVRMFETHMNRDL